jgi:hypothetical protein
MRHMGIANHPVAAKDPESRRIPVAVGARVLQILPVVGHEAR